MGLPFLLGHGTENDFVLLPDPSDVLDLTPERVRALCDRRAGLGADGVLRVVRRGEGWFMDYRNADGGISEMCGNGIRVFARYLYDEGLVPDGPVRIDTRDGVKTVTRDGEGFTADVGPARVVGETKVSVGDRSWPATHVDVGNPHAVAFVDDLGDAGPLFDEPSFDHSAFPEGVNVEFVVRRGPGHVAMRVHERGSGETRSCGTGACAVAAAAAGGAPGVWRVDVPGGTLTVTLEADGRALLTGPAVILARGETDL